MKKQLLCVMLLGASSFGLLAQERSQSIEEVTLHGKFLNLPYKKVNENVIVITKKEIENAPAKSIDEVLQQFTGMDIRRRGANGVQSDVSIRGGSFDQVLVLINGIRMNDSQTGHNNMNIPVDLSNVDRIEVIKGPASRRFGQNAYAGVINIITKTAADKTVKVSASGGDFSTYALGLSATGGNENFTQLFQANTAASEGYRYNTDYKIRNVFYQNNIKIKDGSIKMQAGFTEKKFGANGFYASPLYKDQYEETQASVVSVAYQQQFGNLGLNANAYWRRGQDMYLFVRNKPQAYRNLHIGNNVGGELNVSYKSSLGTTGLGLELRKEFFVSHNNNPAISMGSRERFVTQLFFEHHFSLINDKLQVSPGVSWASYGDEGNFFYPGLDVGFDFDSHNKIYGNISKVHRVPTFTDLYYISKTEVGNSALKPESAVSSELGYRYQSSKFSAKLSGFMRDSQDAIDWVKANATDPWRVMNIGQIKSRGVEVEVSQKPAEWISYSLGYTYLDKSYHNPQNLMSKYALENLKHQFVARLENKFLNYFSNELVYKYNERVNLGSYNLLDDRLSFTKGDLSIYVLVNNLTNTKYTESSLVPMPGRWFHIGFSYKIGY
ncbi:TonB-dependent receptor [Riemerella columbipharyngis]|uniref:Iron complex outermembrane recepter protein n=1 Tax=Riemerella columbipharyngis TaxID=1071918 RepID=A0A1G7BR64_9FLAO|nr:TonB-dependent receptor [Riemerella columbipharyngis]SDE29442.1 iron complex outermembrane recepter protein [Riemerella columbipharyngis]